MCPFPRSPAKSRHRQAALNSSLAVLPFQVELISSGPAFGNAAGISAGLCCSSPKLKRIYTRWRFSPEVWMHLSCTVVQRGRKKHTPLIVAENKRLWGYKRLLSHGDSFFSLSTPKLTCGALNVADAALCLFKNHTSVCPLCNVHLSVWFPISSDVTGEMTPSGDGVLWIWLLLTPDARRLVDVFSCSFLTMFVYCVPPSDVVMWHQGILEMCILLTFSSRQASCARLSMSDFFLNAVAPLGCKNIS